ncbi:MAG: hypothetical protein RIC38_07385 [Chromatocurvus sp.]
MTASPTIDADRVHALNRLIREKTGRVDSGPEHAAAPRKNLWLQVPAAGGDRTVRKPRRPARSRRTTPAPDTGAAVKGDVAQRIRRLLTLLLSAALLLATAATAVDLLTPESRAPGQEGPARVPAFKRAAVAVPVSALEVNVRDLRSENQRLRERLRELDRRLRVKGR